MQCLLGHLLHSKAGAQLGQHDVKKRHQRQSILASLHLGGANSLPEPLRLKVLLHHESPLGVEDRCHGLPCHMLHHDCTWCATTATVAILPSLR
ncbi:hypothetical protein GUJ93_ZPchr0006g45615 [Zizania palustris]|uniref:Uncharacterized protein n=1 Tax=Zizania palustris TaxID=103762 RepID=A0A8J5SIC0_ZIZPA|nr:hypothetical protein GUJ93_ZPchr0006g45615 [Zizania palustris]